jgi:hypothetical protein
VGRLSESDLKLQAAGSLTTRDVTLFRYAVNGFCASPSKSHEMVDWAWGYLIKGDPLVPGRAREPGGRVQKGSPCHKALKALRKAIKKQDQTLEGLAAAVGSLEAGEGLAVKRVASILRNELARWLEGYPDDSGRPRGPRRSRPVSTRPVR